MNNGLGVRWDDLPLLRERAVSLLLSGPARAPALAQRIFGWRQGPPRLAASLVREVLGADPRFELSRGRWLLSEEPAGYGSTRLRDLDFVVVDVETTGGSPARGDRVTEVAALRVRDGQIVDSLESLVNPGRPIPPSVTALGAVFVAHNAGFDWRFLQSEFTRCRRGRLGGERVCTLRLARRLHPEFPRRSLNALADYYAIGVDSWHRAGSDARATAELFMRFLGQLADQGVADWGRLQAYLRGEYPPELARERKKRGKRSREELRH